MPETIASKSPPLGIVDMSFEEYQSIPALSNSGMKDLAVSPLRFWHLHLNPEAPEREETPALKMGHALHCAVLESDEAFESRYACALDKSDWPVCLDTMEDLRRWINDQGYKPKGTRKDEVIQQALWIMENSGARVPILAEEERRFFAKNEGKTILQPDEWRRVTGMYRALAAAEALKPILAEGKAEVSIFARDPETGVLLKARLDWLAPKCQLNLKSFSQMRGKSIDKTVADALWFEAYLQQAYFYTYVWSLVTGLKHLDYIAAFCESAEPFETRLKVLRPTTGGQANGYWVWARGQVRHLIRTYSEHMARFGERRWLDPQVVEPLIDDDIKQLLFA